MKPSKQLQLQLNAERYSRRYEYCPVQEYVTVSPRYVARTSALETAVDDPLSLMNENRLYLSRLKIGLLSSQVGMRGYVHEKIVSGIEADELFCSTEAARLEGLRDYDGAARLRLDQLARLSRERRAAEVDCFRDIARINKDLIDAILEYKSISNRGEIFNSL